MLTKNDLQNLRSLIREEIEVEGEKIKRELQAEIKLSRMGIELKLGIIDDRIKNVEISLSKIQKDLSTIISYSI